MIVLFYLLLFTFVLADESLLPPSSLQPMLYNMKGKWVDVGNEFPGSRPQQPASENWKDPNTLIFVSITHYRDPRCATTLKNLYSKAMHPQRLRFAIIQQRHTEEDFFKCYEDFIAEMRFKNNFQVEKQFRVIEFTHQQSYGPNFARSFTHQLLQDEEFCLQLDSHSDVVQNWDVELTDMWGLTENEMAILSTQPVDISMLGLNDNAVPHLCQAKIDERGVVINLPPTRASHLTRPILAPLYSEAFSFGKCHSLRKVPNDPFLRSIYDGDEFAKFLRLWVAGYDIYTPHKNIVGHDYLNKQPVVKASNRVLNPMEWTSHGNMKKDFIRALYDESIDRLNIFYGKSLIEDDSTSLISDHSILEMMLQTNKYGAINILGSSEIGAKKRDLIDFIAFTGVDTIKKEIYADRCESLTWVPFVAHQDPYVIEGDLFGLNSESLSSQSQLIPISNSKEIDLFSLSFYTQSNPAGGPQVLSSPNSLSDLGNLETNNPVIESRIITSVTDHRGGELWFIFQFVDSFLEQVINKIDIDVGYGHGHRVMRALLLFLPVLCALIGFALWVLNSSGTSKVKQ